jgi:hypothetical protein
VDVNNGTSGLFVGEGEIKLAIEAARATEGWVDGIGSIRCTNDDNLSTIVHAIHKSQQCRDDGGMGLLLLA